MGDDLHICSIEAEKNSRKVKGYRELEFMQRKLNPSLIQQEQVA